MHERLCRAWRSGAVVLAGAWLAGCTVSSVGPVSDLRPGPAPLGPAASGDITRALYEQLDRWRGTRYRYGGLSSAGIDCSGLALVVYRDLFDEQLPRTTERQGSIGRAVDRRQLAPGDLVFFKTGAFRKHVGIYVENGMFLHASRSHGVRMSSLRNEYWRDHYWKARRMTDIQAGL